MQGTQLGTLRPFFTQSNIASPVALRTPHRAEISGISGI